MGGECRDAHDVALCMRIGEGDEVIVPAYTYTASASVVAHVGAPIKMVDIQKDVHIQYY